MSGWGSHSAPGSSRSCAASPVAPATTPGPASATAAARRTTRRHRPGIRPGGPSSSATCASTYAVVRSPPVEAGETGEISRIAVATQAQTDRYSVNGGDPGVLEALPAPVREAASRWPRIPLPSARGIASAMLGQLSRGSPPADLDERDPDYIRENLAPFWLAAS